VETFIFKMTLFNLYRGLFSNRNTNGRGMLIS